MNIPDVFFGSQEHQRDAQASPAVRSYDIEHLLVYADLAIVLAIIASDLKETSFLFKIGNCSSVCFGSLDLDES